MHFGYPNIVLHGPVLLWISIYHMHSMIFFFGRSLEKLKTLKAINQYSSKVEDFIRHARRMEIELLRYHAIKLHLSSSSTLHAVELLNTCSAHYVFDVLLKKIKIFLYTININILLFSACFRHNEHNKTHYNLSTYLFEYPRLMEISKQYLFIHHDGYNSSTCTCTKIE